MVRSKRSIDVKDSLGLNIGYNGVVAVTVLVGAYAVCSTQRDNTMIVGKARLGWFSGYCS
jgi:hypothetical protein